MAEDYYGVLGVDREATTADIKKAFREIARKCHPDVAGADATAEERFKAARQAYETLMDPVARARYDRRAQRRAAAPPAGGSFFDAFYKTTGRASEARARGGRQARGKGNPGNAVSLDDLFNDFGAPGPTPPPASAGGDFGFGEGKAQGRSEAGGTRLAPEPGDEVQLDLEVSPELARDGGSITAVYYRMQRADSWRPGSTDPGLVRIQDIADIRIVPGTPDGALLRERGLGSAGANGGPYGDLVATVRIVARRGPAEAPAAADAGEGRVVDITIVEALLGGRVTVITPAGSVRVTIPPGTSSGARLRLKGRGETGSDGNPSDLFVVTRIVVPKELDAESRALIEAYARLNPSG